ncbi:poly polymerase catalytic domain-containing protein [Penicillium malachiteum]|uniref:poly polymerase catalytic domain-containing protein n=1 Tax=Penicillium malachiteum TaxID=1324776 RepID=UPI002547647B|nr:poly polymerase catalytic domain-containing protein [Penicillium malachiteum]KAJ5731537.1 poly polymerase catalytic domain-containing protein [Penicillium malachiteum]
MPVKFPFRGKDIVISSGGAIPGHTQDQVKNLAECLSAAYSAPVTKRTTHLITTQKEVDKKIIKYRNALTYKCHVVTIDWLLACKEQGTNVSVENFLIIPTPKGTKRANSEDSELEDSNKRQKAMPPKAPVDPEFFLNNPFPSEVPAVWIDEEDDVIWDATLNQTDSVLNRNKFYRIQLLEYPGAEKKYLTWTHWGRVGEGGQSAVLSGQIGHSYDFKSAKDHFEKKFKAKAGMIWTQRLIKAPVRGKYTFIERSYSEDPTDENVEPTEEEEQKSPSLPPKVECTLDKPLQDLISFIFNANHFQSAMEAMSYDSQKLPLGKLSDRTLKTGFALLKEIAQLHAETVHSAQWQADIERISNQYFTTIPHNFGRKRPPILISDQLIRREIELLEALTDMDVANEIMKDSKLTSVHELDLQFRGLGMKEMSILEHSSTEFKELTNYLTNSRGATHSLNYTVIDIFRMERQGEEDRFKSSPYSAMQKSDRRLLWHGSRSTNFGGILSQGLRIAPPEAPVNGYMFGKGVYLADTSTKSANYCCPHSSGNKGLLLLCDVELGDPMLELYNGDYTADEKARAAGKVATLGQGRTVPAGWKDASVLNANLQGVKMPDMTAGQRNDGKAYLQYNEYIVYDVAQIRQRYLFYVQMK